MSGRSDVQAAVAGVPADAGNSSARRHAALRPGIRSRLLPELPGGVFTADVACGDTPQTGRIRITGVVVEPKRVARFVRYTARAVGDAACAARRLAGGLTTAAHDELAGLMEPCRDDPVTKTAFREPAFRDGAHHELAYAELEMQPAVIADRLEEHGFDRRLAGDPFAPSPLWVEDVYEPQSRAVDVAFHVGDGVRSSDGGRAGRGTPAVVEDDAVLIIHPPDPYNRNRRRRVRLDFYGFAFWNHHVATASRTGG